MKYYKVIKNNRVIDVLSSLTYVRFNPRHNTIFTCDDSHAEGFLSSDKTTIFRQQGMPINVEEFDTVELVEMDIYEYNQLKALTLKTPQEIIDAYTLSLIDGGVI